MPPRATVCIRDASSPMVVATAFSNALGLCFGRGTWSEVGITGGRTTEFPARRPRFLFAALTSWPTACVENAQLLLRLPFSFSRRVNVLERERRDSRIPLLAQRGSSSYGASACQSDSWLRFRGGAIVARSAQPSDACSLPVPLTSGSTSLDLSRAILRTEYPLDIGGSSPRAIRVCRPLLSMQTGPSPTI